MKRGLLIFLCVLFSVNIGFCRTGNPFGDESVDPSKAISNTSKPQNVAVESLPQPSISKEELATKLKDLKKKLQSREDLKSLIDFYHKTYSEFALNTGIPGMSRNAFKFGKGVAIAFTPRGPKEWALHCFPPLGSMVQLYNGCKRLPKEIGIVDATSDQFGACLDHQEFAWNTINEVKQNSWRIFCVSERGDSKTGFHNWVEIENVRNPSERYTFDAWDFQQSAVYKGSRSKGSGEKVPGTFKKVGDMLSAGFAIDRTKLWRGYSKDFGLDKEIEGLKKEIAALESKK